MSPGGAAVLRGAGVLHQPRRLLGLHRTAGGADGRVPAECGEEGEEPGVWGTFGTGGRPLRVGAVARHQGPLGRGAQEPHRAGTQQEGR